MLTPHTHKVTCSVLANDDSFLVTGSSDSSAKVGGSFKVRYLKVKGKSSGDQSRDWRGASLVHGAHRKRCVAAAHHEQRVSDHGYVFLPFSVAQESLPSGLPVLVVNVAYTRGGKHQANQTASNQRAIQRSVTSSS